MLDYRVISIGTLAAHPLWNERADVRTAHATTVLLRTDDMSIIIDPSLPIQALEARLGERANLRPADITHVFLTSFEPTRRRAIRAFDHATWWISQAERELIGATLVQRLKEAHDAGDADVFNLLQEEVAILERCTPAPDALAEGIDLFPLPGVTPGLTGLLLALPHATVVICGDAIPTLEHLRQGKVLPNSADLEKAQQSFSEAVEIADALILGRDGLVLNPLRRF